MVKIYNINELLELRKELENKVKEKTNFQVESLTYVEDKYTDYTNNKNNRIVKPRVKTTLNEYTTEIFNILSKLSKVKTSIQKFNSENNLIYLNERESIRNKLKFLENIKKTIPTEVKSGRQVTRQDKDGGTIEVREQIIEPMFELKEVEKQYDQLAAEERKLNTGIQKRNLNAAIELI